MNDKDQQGRSEKRNPKLYRKEKGCRRPSEASVEELLRELLTLLDCGWMDDMLLVLFHDLLVISTAALGGDLRGHSRFRLQLAHKGRHADRMESLLQGERFYDRGATNPKAEPQRAQAQRSH